MRPHSFRTLLVRALAAAGLVALGVAGPAGAARAAPAAGGITLASLSFPSGTVDAAGGHATATLTWAVRDSNPAAASVSGDIIVRMAGPRPGTFIGRAFDISFGFPNGALVSGTGTAADSAYSYDFVVPPYSFATTANWVVTKVTVTDDQGGRLALSGSGLDHFGGVLTATELVDSTPPVAGSPSLLQPRAFAYNGGGQTPSIPYDLTMQDFQSGFWKGRLTLTGPGGQVIHAPFSFVTDLAQGFPAGTCGFEQTDVDQANCLLDVSFPPGTPAGTWPVTAITVWDNAGNHATTRHLDDVPVIVSADQGIAASGFTVSPSQVNDWATFQTVTLTLSVSGAQGGVTAIAVDFAGANPCLQLSTTPVQNADGTFSTTFRMFQGQPECQVAGLAVTDGSGNAAIYGSNYGAPDPGITVTQVPDTIPPTATSAALSPTSISGNSAERDGQVGLTVGVSAPIAPVNQMSVTLLDSSGNVVEQEGGGASEFNGTVFTTVPLPNGTLPPGTYTVAFTITDAGGLSASYGFPGTPEPPGGPLLLTLTS